MLKALIVIIFSLPFVLLGNYLYKNSDKYKEDLKDKELKKQDDIENQKLQNFINILEQKSSR